MASGRSWTNTCSECGRPIEILNGDLEFSIVLHNQSHKSLDYVNDSIDRNIDSVKKVNNATKLNLNYCHECKESIEIVNNDLSLSFQLHAQKHKPDSADAVSDHSSSSSGKSRRSQKETRSQKKEQNQPVLTSILDAIFHTMPLGLKAHQSFILEQGCSKAICNLCEMTIEPIFSLSEHLKTKLHEDNTIQAIKTILPSELHNHMEYISFYGSNLCCNLCRCKVDLCSNNLHQTVVNIFGHNAGKGHLSMKTVNNDSNQSDKTLVILKSLALINPLVNENQHLIEHKMYPFFKCKPCDKRISYSENQNEMVNNFTDHFNSSGHSKHLSAVSLLNKLDSLNIAGKENHNFVLSKHSIFCTSCRSVVETNLDQILAHVRNTDLNRKGQSEFVSGMQATNVQNVETVNNLSFKEENMSSNIKNGLIKPSMDQIQEQSAKFRRLLQSVPVKFRSIITQSKKGDILCSVCKCVIPPTTFNLTTHLNGSSHAKKQNEAKLSERIPNKPQPLKTFGVQAKEPPANLFIGSNLGASYQHPLQLANREYFVRYGDENKYICILCGTIIQGDGISFEKNILSHIESQDHVFKVQLKEEMSRLLPRHRDFLVRELFDLIPLRFQSEMKFIKAPEGENFVFCEICYLKIPRHRNCVVEHLEGVYHETSVERFGKIQHKKVEVKSDDCDTQYQELLRSNKEIKVNSKYVQRKNEDYFCTLCKAVIKNSYDIKLIEQNIMSHISGKKHKKSLEGVFTDMLDRVQLSSEVVKNNRSFLKKENDKVVCTLCSCQMPLTENIDSLRYNLEVHFSGHLHGKNKLESEVNTPSTTKKLESETNAPSSCSETASSMSERESTWLAQKMFICDILGHDEDHFYQHYSYLNRPRNPILLYE